MSFIPPAPIVTATAGKYEDRIEVEWKPVKGATYYKLYRRWSEGGAMDELTAGEGGYVGLKFNPVYNAQWKETGEWQQTCYAYPLEGYAFEGWFDAAGRALCREAEWRQEYGTSGVLFARFVKNV